MMKNINQCRHQNTSEQHSPKPKRKCSDKNESEQKSERFQRSREKKNNSNGIQPKLQQIEKQEKRQQSNDNNDSNIDMFADSFEVTIKQERGECGKQTGVTDEAGYYIPIVGSIIGEKYRIVERRGKGVYSTVAEVVDISDGCKRYAVKILRKNEMTHASGCREYKMLSQMHQSRKLKRIMKAYDMFEVHGHLAILCQFLGTDLRSFSYRQKSTLADIRTYAIGMILIWHELRLCRVIHADIKPDNFLFKQSPQIIDSKQSQAMNQRAIIDNLKLADFGNAFLVEEYNPNVEYQVARYYRAPEIILGTKTSFSQIFAIDVWAMGCSLFQLYANQFLFNGSSNNEMLKLMMQTRGKFCNKMLSKSAFRSKHFDENFNFLYSTVDKVTKQQKIQKIQVSITEERDLMNMLKKQGKNENPKQLQNFRDFLQKCLTLNPKDRITPQSAIQHPFLHFQTKLQE